MANDYKEDIKKLTEIVANLLWHSQRSPIVEYALGFKEEYMRRMITELLPYPYGQELIGISDASGVSIGSLFLYNIIYELTSYNQTFLTMCTSVVARNKEGVVFHARNLDYGKGTEFTDALRHAVINVDFQLDGKTHFIGTTFPGLVGLLTGQRPNKYTITLNQRFKGDFWMTALEALRTGAYAMVFLTIRDVIANPIMDFNAAMERLTTTPLIAPCYLTVGGIKQHEGAIITRDRRAAKAVRWLGINGEDPWYLLVTNYDHWDPVPEDDDRRGPAIEAMNELGEEGVSVDGLFHVLSVVPVLNPSTVYTTAMSAQDSELYTSWARWYDGPVPTGGGDTCQEKDCSGA